MRHIRLPARALRVAGVVLRMWWKVRKPTTFGVKVLLLHPDDAGQCLIVRHSYGDSNRWGLPGGGYKPGRETAHAAAVREIAEELALTIADTPTALETVLTELEGKRDTLTIVKAVPTSAEFVLSPELTEARWAPTDIQALHDSAPVSRWLLRALAHIDDQRPSPNRLQT